jgi:hypothetical protein
MRKETKMRVEIQDFIRSYDFKPMLGRDDCFVEGQVLELTNECGYSAYKIRVSKDSWDDPKYTRVGDIILVPLKVSFGEYAGRIVNLSRL